MKKIYLDHAAATPVEPAISRKMIPYFSHIFGNPSSMHLFGREAKKALDAARTAVAATLNASPEEIIFTASGTESDNLALFGIAEAHAHIGKHIVVSKIEHKAVLEAAKQLEKRGFEVTYLNVDADGLVRLDELKRALRSDTILVSIMYANNEIGTVQPITEIAVLIAEHRRNKRNTSNGQSGRITPIFHTDACQAAGALPLDVHLLGVDLMTLNGSKIYGPKGSGCLYKRKDIRIEPQIVGGEQEMVLRAGSENVAAIVGFAEALMLAEKLRVKESVRLRQLRDYTIERLLSAIPNSRLNGHRKLRLPNNINISLFGIEGESILLMLDRHGIAASTGSACAAYDLVPSHVLLAIGLSAEFAHGSVRFTMGRKTTKAEMDIVINVLPEIAANLRAISPIRNRPLPASFPVSGSIGKIIKK